MRMRLAMGLVAAAVIALVVAASAQAAASQSMVYIANGNVFIANADGSNPHQVTTDGKASSSAPLSDPASDNAAYHSPTEAADGTIWAPNGFALYHPQPERHADQGRRPTRRRVRAGGGGRAR